MSPRKKTGARAQALSPDSSTRTVLIASTGLSPAVLTETIWALAQESPSIIPDEVIVITTKTGKSQIEKQLFGADEIWQQLRHAILGEHADDDPRLDFDNTPDRIKVVHHRVGSRRQPLDELATPEQNTAFADAIANELWTHASKPDVSIIASLAGGFKTMSALMLSTMQLLANPGDRITHVLIGEGYDTTDPLFFFPKQKNQKLTHKITKRPLVAASAAKHIQLINVPVIPLRRWFADALNCKPPSYDTLVHSSIKLIQNRLGDVTLELGPKTLGPEEKDFWMRLNSIEHRLSPQRYAYLRFFAEEAKTGIKADSKILEAVDRYVDWCRETFSEEPSCHRVITTAEKTVTKGEYKGAPNLVIALPQRMNDLRTFLEKLPGGQALSAALPSKGRWGLDVASERITLH